MAFCESVNIRARIKHMLLEHEGLGVIWTESANNHRASTDRKQHR